MTASATSDGRGSPEHRAKAARASSNTKVRNLSAWGFSQAEVRDISKSRQNLILELLEAILDHTHRLSGRNWERHAYLLALLHPKFPMPYSWGLGAGVANGQPRPVIAISIEKARELQADHDKLVPRVKELLERNGNGHDDETRNSP